MLISIFLLLWESWWCLVKYVWYRHGLRFWFFDSLNGLIFFMLLGKMFQIKPIFFWVSKGILNPISNSNYQNQFGFIRRKCGDLRRWKGDRLLIRNQELIPVDGILISENAEIDYSFVTGEAIPIAKQSGDKVLQEENI
jgi:Cu+-exporting ATPase